MSAPRFAATARSGSPRSSRAVPLTYGVAELVAYLSLRDEAFTLVYRRGRAEQISWTGPDGQRRTATLPRVTFTRGDGHPGRAASDDRARSVRSPSSS